MEGLSITKLTSDLSSEAAEVLAEAYLKEPIISTLLDLSDLITKRTYIRIHKVWLDAYIKAQQPLFVATIRGQVIGLAVVKESGFNLSFGQIISSILPKIALLAILGKAKFLQMFRLRRALEVPKNIPKSCYTLEVIAVHPVWQGKGVGRSLLEEIHRICGTEKKFSTIYLYAGSRENRDFYEHFGYCTVKSVARGNLEVHHMLRKISN